MQKIPFHRRLNVMLIDFIVGLVYSILIMLLILVILVGVLDGIPRLSHIQIQTLAIFTLSTPLILLFTLLEMARPYGSYGKRIAKLQLNYTKTSFVSSLLRNTFKFIPWIMVQAGVIGMFYSNYIWWWFGLVLLAIAYGAVNIWMIRNREDGRHIADFIAGTYVIERE